MLSSPNVRLYPQAKADIAEILSYLVEALSKQAARDFLFALNQTINTLLNHPRIGVQRTYHSPLLKNVRMVPLGKSQAKYLLFYQAKQGEIHIIRVIHGSRDIDALFSAE